MPALSRRALQTEIRAVLGELHATFEPSHGNVLWFERHPLRLTVDWLVDNFSKTPPPRPRWSTSFGRLGAQFVGSLCSDHLASFGIIEAARSPVARAFKDFRHDAARLPTNLSELAGVLFDLTESCTYAKGYAVLVPLLAPAGDDVFSNHWNIASAFGLVVTPKATSTSREVECTYRFFDPKVGCCTFQSRDVFQSWLYGLVMGMPMYRDYYDRVCRFRGSIVVPYVREKRA